MGAVAFRSTVVAVAILFVNESRIRTSLTSSSSSIFPVSFRFESREGEIGDVSRRAVREGLRLEVR